MKLSTRSRYGLRAMLDLATHYKEGVVLLKNIAKRQKISERYLENIMRILVSNGLVISFRGKKGGFSLARPPEKIRLSEIIQKVEGSLSPVSCIDNPRLCELTKTCVTREIWERLKESILNTLDSITLEDLVKMQEEKNIKPKAPLYYI